MAGVGPGLAGAAVSTGLKVGFGVLEKSVSAAYGVVSKTAGAVGSLAKGMAGASDAMKSAAKVKNQNPESPIVIINNTGMAGSAGKQKISGSGTLPPLKSSATPRVSEKMPTEALLDTAVKYLSGIDKTLKAQLDFERRSFEQQVRDERESQIENKPSSFSFSDIKNRLSGFKSKAQETGSALLTAAKWAAGIGITASLIASALNPKELEELKKNIEAFKEKFSWLNEIPAGGIGGFLLGLLTGKGLKGKLMGGLKGGLIGIATSAVADAILARSTGGKVSEDTKSVLNLAATGGIGYLGYRGIKSGVDAYGNMKAAGAKIADLKANSTVYDPKSGRMRNVGTGAYAATNTATGFLKSPRWQKFLDWLTKRGERVLVNKIQQRIAIAVTTGAITATGVGAVFGAIGFLLNLGFNLYFMYEIYELWKEFTSDEKADKAGVGDAELEKELKKPDAVKSGTIAGAPVASADQLNKLPAIPADIEKILATIRTNESNGNYGENKYKPGSSASGAYQFLDGTWKERAAAAGVGTEYPRAYMAPPEIQDAVAAKYVQDILKMPGVNGDVSKVPLVWLTGNAEGRMSAAGQAANSITPAQYQAKFMSTYTGGQYSASSYDASSGGLGTALGAMAGASLEATAKLFGAIGSAVVKPGIAREFTPSTPNVSERINNDSMKIQNDITFGIKNKQSKDAITSPASPGTPSTSGAGPMKTISSIDPNYGNMDIIKHYVAHFRLAA